MAFLIRPTALCAQGDHLANLSVQLAQAVAAGGLAKAIGKVTQGMEKLGEWVQPLRASAGKYVDDVKNKTSDWYKAFLFKLRRVEMEKWIDPATGKAFRPHELDAAIAFEKSTGMNLKPTTTGKGDFQNVATGKVYDHLGMGDGFKYVPRPKAIEQFKASLDKHIKKDGVDELILDFKDFTPSEISDINKYINSNYSTVDKNRIIFINN